MAWDNGSMLQVSWVRPKKLELLLGFTVQELTFDSFDKILIRISKFGIRVRVWKCVGLSSLPDSRIGIHIVTWAFSIKSLMKLI